MSSRLLDGFDAAWVSTNPGLLAVTVDPVTAAEPGGTANRLVAQPGAAGVQAELLLPAPLDLRPFDELRLWVRASELADGSLRSPFFLELSYLDSGDAPGEEHRWLLPVNRPHTWEQRRIGIQADRRASVTRFRLTCLDNRAFVCHLDALLAVRDELLADVGAALVAALEHRIVPPELTDLPLAQNAAAGATQLVVAGTPPLDAGNQVVVRGGPGTDESHLLTAVTPGAGTTTIDFAVSDPLLAARTAGIVTVSVQAPVVEAVGAPAPLPRPLIALTRLEAREDLERSGWYTQRDSFRLRDGRLVCSTRPSPRAYLVDYQVRALVPRPSQVPFAESALFQVLSADRPLRLNGAPAPIWIVPAPPLGDRVGTELSLSAAVYVRIGTRLEVAPRREETFVRQATVEGGRIDAPLDREGIVIAL